MVDAMFAAFVVTKLNGKYLRHTFLKNAVLLVILLNTHVTLLNNLLSRAILCLKLSGHLIF